MEIRNNLTAPASVQGVTPAKPATQQNGATPSPATTANSLNGDQATVSSVGTGVAQMASSNEVRIDKVAGIQQALADGSYNVPPSAVASKMIDSMLNSGK